jgi:FtsP/CotA-like multicopper oxidase with cupredoxin domain
MFQNCTRIFLGLNLQLVVASLAAALSVAPLQSARAASPGLSDPSGVITLNANVADGYIPGFGTVKGLYLYEAHGPGLPNGIPAGLIPPTISVPAGRNLLIDFKNNLPEASNLHTHGLAVSPVGVGFGQPETRPLYGECILVIGAAAGSNPPAPDLAAKDPCAPRTGPVAGASEAQPIRYRIVVPPGHWPGLFWYHPHVHGQAEKQLVSGMSGLLTIGDLWDYAYFNCWAGAGAPPSGARLCVSTAELQREKALQQAADVKFVPLKDIQVDRAAGTWTRHQTADEFYDKGRCGANIGFDASLPQNLQRAAPLLPGSDTHSAPGACWSNSPDEQWLFTVAGERYPTLTAPPGSVQVWRLANMSADATYRLRVETKDTAAPQCPGSTAQLPPEKQHHCLTFVLLSRDGVPLGAATAKTNEVTLMPSARADVYVPRCDGRKGSASIHDGCFEANRQSLAELTTAGVAVGVTVDAADIWPPASLARVVAEPGSLPGAAAAAPALRSAGVAAPKTVGAPSAADLVMPAAEAAHGASEDASKCNWPAYDRGATAFPLRGHRVRLVRFNNKDFGDNNGGEHFGLHVQNFYLHDAAHPGRHIRVEELLAGAAGGKRLGQVDLFDDCHDAAMKSADGFAKYYPAFPAGHDGGHDAVPTTSAWRSDAPEYWLLVNDSQECHNFHIHQQKFEVAASDVVRDASGASTDQCLGDRDPGKLASHALHDNFPLPPGARLLVKMNFGNTQVGRFVYHCHILEHEDKGMMSAIEVSERPH